jgi:hypothetical protein
MNTHRINSDLDSDAQAIGNYLASAAMVANQTASRVLALDDAALAAWLNSRPPQDTLAMFAAHEALGTAINAAQLAAGSVLAAWGVTRQSVAVDVRPFADKLAERRRVVGFDGSTWTVETLPAPEPEPVENSEEPGE